MPYQCFENINQTTSISFVVSQCKVCSKSKVIQKSNQFIQDEQLRNFVVCLRCKPTCIFPYQCAEIRQTTVRSMVGPPAQTTNHGHVTIVWLTVDSALVRLINLTKKNAIHVPLLSENSYKKNLKYCKFIDHKSFIMSFNYNGRCIYRSIVQEIYTCFYALQVHQQHRFLVPTNQMIARALENKYALNLSMPHGFQQIVATFVGNVQVKILFSQQIEKFRF